MKTITLVSLTAVFLCGCAGTKETTFWERGKHNTVIVHHVHHTQKGTADRTEELTAKVIDPAQIHTYDLGRMPDANGNVHEAHRYYVVTQSSHINLMLPPAKDLHPTGPRSIYTPPNYTPMPKDQRINDAVSEARQAKDKLDEARGKIDQQLANDNNLKGQLEQQSEQIQDLQSQLNSAMSTPTRSPAPAAGGQQSDASKAGTVAGSDPLALWGKQVQP
jgi:hypothetical protein